MKYENSNKTKLRFVGTSHGTIVLGHICDDCIYNNAKFSCFGEHPKICFFDQTARCSARKPYYFFQSRSTKSVAIFSKWRIPFELPKVNTDAIKDFKTELTLALKLLQPFENSFLCARYGTTDVTKKFFDIENVLFYNIGTKNFNALTKQRIAFAAIPCSEIEKIRNQWNIPEDYSHYYEYTLLPEPMPLPQEKTLLAEWENISFCKCTGLTPFASWNSIRSGRAHV